MVVHSLVHNMSVVMEGKQTYSVCTLPFILRHFSQDGKASIDDVRNLLGIFVGTSQQVPVSD